MFIDRYMIDPRLEPFAENVVRIIDHIEYLEPQREHVSWDEVLRNLDIYHDELAQVILSAMVRCNLVSVWDEEVSLTDEGRAASRVLKLLASYGPIMSMKYITQAWSIRGFQPPNLGYVEFIVEWMYNNNILIGFEATELDVKRGEV